MKKRILYATKVSAVFLVLSLATPQPCYAASNAVSLQQSFNEMSLEEIELIRLASLERVNNLILELKNLHEEVMTAPVCSEANRAYNKIHDLYNEYILEEYSFVLYSSLYKIKYWDEHPGETTDFIEKEIQDQDETKETIKELCDEAKARADALVEEYTYWMEHLVNAEASANYAFDQYCVANVIENRIKHSAYPNTIRGVIYDSGQYECTWDGNFEKTPTTFVKKNVEDYLRGRVDTGMPDNVVYQAKHSQGKGVWKRLPNGHLYCYR